MGWADCGVDRRGRPIGYAFEATCDEEGCEEEIDRGLAFACGGMHGEDTYSCERYFCSAHLFLVFPEDFGLDEEVEASTNQFCRSCLEAYELDLKERGAA